MFASLKQVRLIKELKLTHIQFQESQSIESKGLSYSLALTNKQKFAFLQTETIVQNKEKTLAVPILIGC